MKEQKSKHIVLTFLAIFVLGAGLVGAASGQNTSQENLFADFDQDGLSNDEEASYGTDPNNRDSDGDGYSDYTEVQSGYDPLIPAPGDKIVKEEANIFPETSSQVAESEGQQQESDGESSDVEEDEINLTEKAATDLAGLIASGQTQDVEVTMENIDSMIQEALDQSSQDIVLPEIKEEDITIKEQDYDDLDDEERQEQLKKDAQEYLVAVAYILAAQSPQSPQSQEELPALSSNLLSKAVSSFNSGDFSYIQELGILGENVVNEMRDISVPESMLQLHKRGLQLALYGLELEEKVQPTEEDPIGNIATIAKAQAYLTLLMDFAQEIESTFEEYDLSEIPIEL